MKKFITYVFPFTLLIVALVNFLFGNTEFNSLHEKLKYYETLNDLSGQNKTYKELIQEDSLNIDYHYYYIQSHFSLPRAGFTWEEGAEVRDDNQLMSYYDSLIRSPMIELSEIGKFGKGLCFYNLELYDVAYSYFIKLDNQNTKYLNYLYSTWDYKSREELYLKEVRCHSDNYLAYQGLADYYVDTKQPNELSSLLSDPNVYDNLTNTHKRYAYFNDGEIKKYAIAIFERFFNGLNVLGFLGAAFILIVWFVYLLKIHKYLKDQILPALIVLVLGMVFAFLTSLLTDFNRYVLGFSRTYDFFHDFYYCVVGIGMIEELVKIIPLLLVVVFSKRLKEPIDFIVFASISALGFAFVENLIYFEDSGLKTIQGRALTATVTHMFNSSLVAYGIVVGKFAKKMWWGIYFIGFYLISSVVHGFYDFWLINNLAQTFSFITFIWLLVSMIIWVSIINNCLNNSYSKKVIWTYNPKKLNNFLLFGLSAVFLLEYLILGYKFGAEAANVELQKDLSSGLFLLIFLTINLSKFDYIPNYWAPLKFWDWDVFMSIPRVEPRFFNLKEIIGAKVKIECFKEDGPLFKHLPVTGEVVSRELINWEKDWYLIKLDEPTSVGWKKQYFLLVKVKNGNSVFLDKRNQTIQVRIVNSIDHLSKKQKRKRDFAFIDFARITKLNL